jgi:hypothetical protein
MDWREKYEGSRQTSGDEWQKSAELMTSFSRLCCRTNCQTLAITNCGTGKGLLNFEPTNKVGREQTISASSEPASPERDRNDHVEYGLPSA